MPSKKKPSARSTSFRFSPKDFELLAEAQALLGLESRAEVVRFAVHESVRRVRMQQATSEILERVRDELPNIVRAEVRRQLAERARKRKTSWRRRRGKPGAALAALTKPPFALKPP